MKNKHELAVCEDFLGFYNKNLKTPYSIIRHGTQGKVNEPDCICSNGLNIEVVTVYYNEAYAKLIWGQARNKITVEEFNKNHPLLINPDQQVFAFLEGELGKKEKKMGEDKYVYDGKLILIIDAANTPLTSSSDYIAYFKERKCNKSNFSEVWVRAFINFGRGNDFLKIFPIP